MLERWFVRAKRHSAEMALADRLIKVRNDEIEGLRADVSRLTLERRDRDLRIPELEAEVRLANETIDGLNMKIADLEVAHGPLTTDAYDKLVKSRCLHCGGAHTISCPRVKRIRFRADGQTPLEVEYHPNFEFPANSIVWIEEHPVIDSPS